MNFRDFITNHRLRQKAAADMARHSNIKPPAHPSASYIKKLVHRLLKESEARDARKELSLMGPESVPFLVEALHDPRFCRASWGKFSHTPTPLQSVLGLLAPHGGEHVLAAAMQLANSPDEEVRKTVALHLASTGQASATALLGDLLKDEKVYVRSYVRTGVDHALSANRADESFRRKMYELLLAQCDQDWTVAGNDCPKTLLVLDRNRAANDLADPKWFTSDNPNVSRILEACNEAGVLLPEGLIRPVLERSLPLAVGTDCYPHNNIVAGALVALTISIGEHARPLLESALGSDQERVHEAAAQGIARLAGVDDPARFVFSRMKKVGYEGLTGPQKVFYLAFVFVAEVGNGGIMQFFGNSSGAHAADTLDALAELGQAEAEAALRAAMKLVGPLSGDPDQEVRLIAFEGRYEELQAAFRPLEGACFKNQAQLRQKMIVYAAQHAEHFGGGTAA